MIYLSIYKMININTLVIEKKLFNILLGRRHREANVGTKLGEFIFVMGRPAQ